MAEQVQAGASGADGVVGDALGQVPQPGRLGPWFKPACLDLHMR